MGYLRYHSYREQKKGWTEAEVLEIDQMIRLHSPLIELVLFHVSIDTMLRVSDLLELRVYDLVASNGIVKTAYAVKQKKTKEKVEVALLPPTQEAVKTFLEETGKHQNDYLFQTSRTPDKPYSDWWMRQLVKKWTTYIGLPPEDYSCHSTRRTGAMHVYKRSGKDLEYVRQALGQLSIEATIHYLQQDRKPVIEILRKYSIWEKQEIKDNSTEIVNLVCPCCSNVIDLHQPLIQNFGRA